MNAPIPLLDLTAQYTPIRDRLDAAMSAVVDDTAFILGTPVTELEAAVAARTGVSYGAGVASGTDALVLALRALDIGPGDEVIVPSFTFFATAEAVVMVGARPVFVDIEPATYGIDVDHVESALTERTRAVIPVHLFGHPADMPALEALLTDRDIAVVEDNAQAFGAAVGGRTTGGMGVAGCLSFFPSKTLAAFGDGGMVVTDDAEVDTRIKMLRTHGWRRKYDPEVIGYNSRLDALQAAVLRVNLDHVDRWNDERRRLAGRYAELLNDSGITLPTERPGYRHVYHLFVVRVPERDAVASSLRAAGIATGVYYPKPLHLTTPLVEFGQGVGSLPESERASRETLAIPLFPTMTSAQQERVAEHLVGALPTGGGRSLPID